MTDLTAAEYAAAMAEIADLYPEYFVTTDEQVAAMATDPALTETTTAYPDHEDPAMRTIDWDAAEDDGLVSYVYADDADDLQAALERYWDDLPTAAAICAWRDVTARRFDAHAFVAAHVTDSETMRLAHATLRTHGGTLDACADWAAVEACLAYWISYDRYLYDMVETRTRLAAAGVRP